MYQLVPFLKEFNGWSFCSYMFIDLLLHLAMQTGWSWKLRNWSVGKKGLSIKNSKLKLTLQEVCEYVRVIVYNRTIVTIATMVVFGHYKLHLFICWVLIGLYCVVKNCIVLLKLNSESIYSTLFCDGGRERWEMGTDSSAVISKVHWILTREAASFSLSHPCPWGVHKDSLNCHLFNKPLKRWWGMSQEGEDK